MGLCRKARSQSRGLKTPLTSHRATWRIQNRRGSNRRRMKIQWQVTSSIPWCPPIWVDTSCQSSLNCRRCGENRAYDRSENIACFWRRRRCLARPLTKYRF
ncbi:hypothetical protein EOS93_30485 [Rhizobium sp. RMa-01]|nr:hypothetical protein EOS93_30485 [Rhizobium sp. RMa-01]